MANDLQVIGRQKLTEYVGVHKDNAYGNIANMFDQFSNATAKIAVGLGIEKATSAGKAAAASGEKRTLAPGLTAATRAYNVAYNDASVGIMSAKLNQLLSMNLLNESAPGRLGTGSIDNLGSLNLATFEGFMPDVPDSIKSEMMMEFERLNIISATKMAEKVQAKNNSDLEASFKVAYDNDNKEYQAALDQGTLEDQKATLQRLDNTISSFTTLLGQPPAVTESLYKNVRQDAINGSLKRGLRGALVGGGERAANQFLANFLNSSAQDNGMTQAQKAEATDFILKSYTDIQHETNRLSQQASNEAYLKMMDDPGSMQNLQDADNYIAERNTQGYPMTQADEVRLKSHILSANKESMKRAQSNALINDLVSTNSIDIANVSNSDLNNWFNDTLQGMQEAENQNVMDGKISEEQRVPRWKKEAIIMGNAGVAIPEATELLNARLTGKNTNNQRNGLKQYAYLKEQNSSALKGLSEQTKAFADSVASEIKVANDDFDIDRIIAERYESTFNASPEVIKARSESYKSYRKKDPDSGIREAFDTGFLGSRAIPDYQRAIFDNIFAKKAELFEANQTALAEKATIAELKGIYQKDDGVAPGNMVVTNAWSNKPWAKTSGHMNKTQGALTIKQIIDTNKTFGAAAGIKIEPSKKMPTMPSSMSDNDKVKTNYAPDGFWAKVNGKECKIYFIDPNYTSTDPHGSNAYQVYYDASKDGKSATSIRPLMTMQKQTSLSGKEEHVLAPATMTLYPPETFTPRLSKEMTQGSAAANDIKNSNTVIDAIEPANGLSSLFMEGLQSGENVVTRRNQRRKTMAQETSAKRKSQLSEAQAKALEKKILEETANMPPDTLAGQ